MSRRSSGRARGELTNAESARKAAGGAYDIPVPPALGGPPTLPLRFVEVGGEPRALNRLVPTEPGLVAIGATGTIEDVLTRWPTVDVLVLHRVPRTYDGTLMCTTLPGQPGTLGWLLRVLATAHVRLAILGADDARHLADMRVLATAAALRGAGAFVVTAARDLPAAVRVATRVILADRSLYAAVPRLPQSATLIAGAGRADALRFATIVRAESRQLPGPRPPTDFEDIVLFQRARPPFGIRARLRGPRIARLRRWPDLRPPLSFGLRVAEDRYLNAHVLSDAPALTVGERVRIQFDIGAFDDIAAAMTRATRLYEEEFWRTGEDGVWLDLAISGIDFEVVGSPIQELWLPRQGVSEPRTFLLVPRTPGVAMLRYCLYRGNDVIQSWRLAALTAAPGRPSKRADRKRFAALVGGEPGERAWAAQLEYALTGAATSAPNRPRDLCIVANDIAGRPVITVRGDDLFTARVNADLPDVVRGVRQVLDEVSGGEAAYAFGDDVADKPGAADAALQRLADVGWPLYDAVIVPRDRSVVEERLAGGNCAIHVAHVLLDHVVPWAVMYDRPFDPRARSDEHNNPLLTGTCRAPWVNPDAFTTMRCGDSPECLLRHDGYVEKTVACPLHFWGFRHRIEIPPQQAPNGEPPTDLVEQIDVSDQARWRVGANKTLDLAADHIGKIQTLATERGADVATSWARDDVVRALGDPSLDLAYLYCHARGAPGEHIPPELLIGAPDADDPGAIRPADLAGTAWEHHPLVMLNGCGTVAFSPRALSPFVTKLVADRGAAGAIGTETSVWEQLACEVGLRLLRELADGVKAGEALRRVRHALLLENNPLGLVYTLYASLDLRFAPGTVPHREADAISPGTAEEQSG